MSLTSMIKDKDSKLMKGLAGLGYSAQSLQNFVDEHNNRLAEVTPTVSGWWQQSDWPLTGSAVIHLMARHSGGKTLIYDHCTPDVIEYMLSLTPSMGALMGALIEQAIRNGTQPKLTAGHLTLPSGNLLVPKENKPVLTKLGATHAELKVLEPAIEAFAKRYEGFHKEYHKTFDLSLSVGGADANLYMEGFIYDIKTSRKRRPLTADDLIQQLVYGLMAYAEGTDIQGINFFYPRHNMEISYHMSRGLVLGDGYHSHVQEFIDQLFGSDDDDDDYVDTQEDYYERYGRMGDFDFD